MSHSESIFLPAFGKVVELRHLDDFVWATLHGWGALPARNLLKRVLPSPTSEGSPEAEADKLARDLKDEEEKVRLLRFTDSEASREYPYLFSLVAVRLWALAEAAAREVLVEAVKRPAELPDKTALARLKGPIAPFVNADQETRAELLADAFWHSLDGQYRGPERFDAVLNRIGLGGSVHTTIAEILRELSEVRHCVVHRGGLADPRLLATCP